MTKYNDPASLRGVVAGPNSNLLRAAFSLIEMLVVIAIIGIVAGFLLSALASAQEQGRATQCLGNLRQWGTAFNMYAQDNTDFLPRRGQGVQPLTQIGRPDDWFNALPDYFGLPAFCDMVTNGATPAPQSQSVFICPTAINTNPPGEQYFLPYGMNMNLSPWNLPQPAKITEIQIPSCVVAMAEAPGPYSAAYPSVQPYSIVARHSKHLNLLFLSGQTGTFAGAYAGCGTGDPGSPDVRWVTGTASDANAPNY